MNFLSRKEINERLEKLRESRHDDASYTVTRPAMAMCYSMSFPKSFSVKRKCANCGIEYEIHWSSHDKNSIETFERIVEIFIELGLECKLVCKCNECIKKFKMNEFEIWIKSFDEDNWHVSVPGIVSIFDYDLVLKFLTLPADTGFNLPDFFDKLYNVDFRKQELAFFVGQDIIDKQEVPKKEKPREERQEKEKAIFENKALFFSGRKPIDFYSIKNLTLTRAFDYIRAHSGGGYIFNRFMTLFSKKYLSLTYKGVYSDNFTHYYEDTGCIKYQIDEALKNVLGLEIKYDELEEQKHKISQICIEEDFSFD